MDHSSSFPMALTSEPSSFAPSLCRVFPLILATALLAAGSPIAAAQRAPASAPSKNSAGASPAPITLASPDAALAERLRGIYANVDGLQDVTVEVRSSVVRLGGAVLTGDDARRAESIASRLAGVVEVDNRIAAETRVRQRIAPLAERVRGWGRQAVAYLPLVAVALLVLLGFRLLGRLLTRVLRPFRRRAPNLFVEELLGQAIRLAFTLAGLVAAMSILGLTALLTTVLGAAGVLGLAVGVAVRDTIENYIASILLSLRQPFAPGDHVLLAGFEGRIALLNSRATVLVTLDGNEVRIPNATVYKTIITNFAHLPERRFEFEVGIGSDEDAGEALKLATATLGQVTGVLQEPAPLVLVDKLGDYSTILKLYGWVDQSQADFAKVRSAAIRRVKAAYDEAGVAMPPPVQEVRLSRQAAPERDAPTVEADAVDTRPDSTIQRKAEAVRAGSGRDLLDSAAPRE